MAVRCSKCGEELLGPVNRCWKCGQTFATLPDAGGLPPVRREAMPLASAPAEPPGAAADQGIVAAQTAASPLAASLVVEDAVPASTPTPSAAIRTGSPFVPGAKMVPATNPSAAAPGVGLARPNRPKAPATQELIRDHVAVAGAIGSLVLGGFALSVSWMSNPTAVIGGALIAILGLAMGMWGLYSRRRGWALFGMLICVAAISLASYSGAMLIFDAQMEAREMEGRID